MQDAFEPAFGLGSSARAGLASGCLCVFIHSFSFKYFCWFWGLILFLYFLFYVFYIYMYLRNSSFVPQHTIPNKFFYFD